MKKKKKQHIFVFLQRNLTVFILNYLKLKDCNDRLD